MKKLLVLIIALIAVTTTVAVSASTLSAHSEDNNGASAAEIHNDNIAWDFDPFTGTLIISGSGPMDDYYLTAAPWAVYRSTSRP